MTRDDLLGYLGHDNTLAFLRLIREGESSQDESAYTVMFGGDHFSGFADHPRILHVVKGLKSTAAGAYQFLARTWDEMRDRYKLPDFSPVNQDCAAVGLIVRRGAIDDVLAGRVNAAIRKCANEWASLPGSTYGQPTQKLKAALDVYKSYGGRIAGEAPAVDSTAPHQQEKAPMAPLIPIILEGLSALLPALSNLGFGSGSEVAKRNVAAGQIVAEELVKVTNAVNLQDAAEKIQNDPAALAAAKDAVGEIVLQLSEVGGGIVEARKVTFSPDQIPPWKNPAVWFAAGVLPLVYLVAVAILFGVGGQTWSDDIKTLFVTAIVTGALGSMTGFFLGSSMSSRNKDALLAGGSK